MNGEDRGGSIHTCPVAGCERRLPARLLMCGRHWARVPKPLQRRVYAAWHSGQPTASYPAARQAAIDAATVREVQG